MRSPVSFHALLVLGFATPNVAYAASFDCNKARLVVEYTICANSELSSLDDQLAARYAEALKTTNDKDALKVEQRRWFTVWNDCKDTECLKRFHANRINELGGHSTQAGEETLPGSETTSDVEQFLGHYVGTTRSTTEQANSNMVIDVEQSDTQGQVNLKLKTWGDFDVASNLTAGISPDGRVSAVGVFAEPHVYVFRESRSWDCKLTGTIRNFTFRGNYRCFPRSVTGTACPQMPGYPCAKTLKWEGSFDLEKFNPSDQ